MKRLILIRHASALPEQFPGKDIDRSLSGEGIREAQSLAGILLEKNHLPEVLLCSPAERTISTARIIRDAFPPELIRIQPSPLLYNAGFHTISGQIEKLPASMQTVGIVGHNPGISQLATVLSAAYPYQFSTAACLCMEFPVNEWKSIQNGSGKEIWYYCP